MTASSWIGAFPALSPERRTGHFRSLVRVYFRDKSALYDPSTEASTGTNFPKRILWLTTLRKSPMFRALSKSGSGSCGRGSLPRRRHESVLRASPRGSLHGSSLIRITRCVCVFAWRRPGAAKRHVFASRLCGRPIAAARMSGTAAECFRFPTGRPNNTIRSWSGWRRGVRPSAATAKVTRSRSASMRAANGERIPTIARNTACGTGKRSAGWCSGRSMEFPGRTTT